MWHRNIHVSIMKSMLMILVAGAIIVAPLSGQYDSDIIKKTDGELEIFFIGHGTLMLKFNDLVIHIDPVMREADYASLPDADLILVTHQHGDHLDMTAISHIMKEDTRVVMTETCMEQLEDFSAIGNPYHPQGEGNGYILSFGRTNVLIGGDTERPIHRSLLSC